MEIIDDDPDPPTWADWTRGVIVELSGRPWYPSEKRLDRAVGKPCELFESTKLKADLLPSKMRYAFFSQFLTHMKDFKINEEEFDKSLQGEPGEIFYTYHLEGKPAETFTKTLYRTATKGAFSKDELVDLAVYVYCKAHPNLKNKWKKYKKRLVEYDIWVGLAVFLAQLGLDDGRIKLRGRIVRIKGDPGKPDKLRIGWLVKLKDLGFKGEPEIEAGFRFSRPLMNGEILYVEDFKRKEKYLKLSVTDALITKLVNPTGWVAGVSGEIKWIINHPEGSNEETRFGEYVSTGNVFLRKKDLFGKNKNLLMSLSQSIDFNGNTVTGIGAAFENQLTDFILLAQVSFTNVGEAEGSSFGLILSGPIFWWDTPYYRAKEYMEKAPKDVQAELDEIKFLLAEREEIQNDFRDQIVELIKKTLKGEGKEEVEELDPEKREEILERIKDLESKKLSARLRPEFFIQQTRKMLCSSFANYARQLKIILLKEGKALDLSKGSITSETLGEIEEQCTIFYSNGGYF